MSIADSDAVLDPKRTLIQHQAALVLLSSRIQDPQVESFKWLDVGCGKGQIIAHLAGVLSENLRKKLTYLGYDISNDFIRMAQRMAEELGLKDHNFKVGNLSDLGKLLEESDKFDFITCTNIAHEIKPKAFVEIILHSIIRLTDDGELYMYDMENLPEPELGALTWKSTEIESLLAAICKMLDSPLEPAPAQWCHSSCNGWSVTINRKHLSKGNEEILAAMDNIASELDKKILAIINEKFDSCCKVLKSLEQYGPETHSDQSTCRSNLYDFWALHNAREALK